MCPPIVANIAALWPPYSNDKHDTCITTRETQFILLLLLLLLTILHVEGNFIRNYDKPIHVLVQLNGYIFMVTLE